MCYFLWFPRFALKQKKKTRSKKMKPPPNGMKRRDTYFNKMIAVKGKNSICVIKSVALHLLRLIKKKDLIVNHCQLVTGY